MSHTAVPRRTFLLAAVSDSAKLHSSPSVQIGFPQIILGIFQRILDLQVVRPKLAIRRLGSVIDGRWISSADRIA
jgi:hypothetical protein